MPNYRYLKIVTDACCHKINNLAGSGKSAGGYFFLSKDGTVISERGCYLGDMTPPQAEYNTLIEALDKAAGLCRGEIEIWSDSEVVIKQMNGDYGLKSENMKPLYDTVKRLEGRFKTVKYFHHPRTATLAKKADQLAEQEFKKNQN